MLLMGITIMIQACTKDSGPIVIPPELPPPPESNDTVSFMNDLMPLVIVKCWFCHPVSGDLYLGVDTAYSQLVNVPAVGWAPAMRVVPYDTAASVLYHKIVGDDVYGLIMPPGGGGYVLTDEEKDLFTRWILQGALNN